MKLNKTFITSVILVLSLVLTACGDDGTAGDGSADGAGSADDAGSADGEVVAECPEPDTEVALLLFSRGFEFMVALDEGAREKADELGVDITVLDGQGDSSVQITQIQDQIAAGVDGLAISPANSEEIVPGVEIANDAGIPVVAVDAIAAGGETVTYVGFDNVEGGATAADHVAELLGGSGKVLELTGAQGAFHANRRGQGFNDQMDAEHPDIEVVTRDAEWSAENALSITVDVLTDDPDISAVFTHNDEMVRGVVTALEQVGRDIPIVGIDGTPTALDRIREGTQAATVNQDPFDFGRIAMDSLVGAICGETDFPEEQLLPPTLVTEENVDDPELWGNIFE